MNTRELIEQSKNILIAYALGEKKNQPIAFALLCGLRKLGKDVRLGEKDTLGQPPSSLSSSPSEGKTFMVSLRGLALWISKVYYEKDERDIRLYFTLRRGEISPENLSLQIQDQTDLAIIVDEDASTDNTPTLHGSWKVVSSQDAQSIILQLLSRDPDPSTRLLGRILERLDPSWHAQLYVASLEQKDFRDSQANPKTLPPLIENLKGSFGADASYLFFYSHASAPELKGIFWSPRKEWREKILQSQKGQERGNWLLFSAPAEKISEIKDLARSFV